MKTFKQMLNDAERYARGLLEVEQKRREIMALHGLDSETSSIKRTGFYRIVRYDHSLVEVPGRSESLLR